MKKKPKKISVIDWVNTGIFSPVICFSCGYSIQELKNYLKKVKAHGWLDAVNATTLDDGTWYGLKRTIEVIKTKEVKNYLFIIIPRFDFNDDDCYVKLAHEALHICQFYLPDVMDRNREFECEAYLHTHIMRQCLSKLRG